MNIYCDASYFKKKKCLVLGVVLEEMHLAPLFFQKEVEGDNSFIGEVEAFALAVEIVAHFKLKDVHFYTDCQSLIHVFPLMKFTKHRKVNKLLKRSSELLRNVTWDLTWIPRECNTEADAATHLHRVKKDLDKDLDIHYIDWSLS